ncbi:MAG TPA: signal peptidase II [Anaeromyxobacteraceae bacterium]|jgi:signal peptidase II|nr:signal peptidase II [Anaeromyxobacteraceae bacterium]
MTLAGKWRLLLALFLALVVADQLTKFLAVDRLTFAFARVGAAELPAKVAAFYRLRYLEPYATQPYYVYAPVWRMNYVENPGAAWGLFRGLSEGIRNAFFTLISIGAVAFILRYYRRLREDQRYLQVALALVLAGAVGNFLDRVARRYVIDFVEWYWWNRPDIRWPTFNLADSLIVVGVALLMLQPPQHAERPAPRG